MCNWFVVLFRVQVSWLHNNGREVVVVTSGAVAFGKLRMKQEQMLSQSVRHTLLGSHDQASGWAQGSLTGAGEDMEPRACAAAGQAGLMALYETMFAQYGVSCAQVGKVACGSNLGLQHFLLLAKLLGFYNLQVAMEGR